ncbi:hypothetical protein D9P05_25050, partial [Salmonella enterica subsp. enterica]|nr:hypothetical protein [Salmonella enterica subsp. enterica serovar Fresno]
HHHRDRYHADTDGRGWKNLGDGVNKKKPDRPITGKQSGKTWQYSFIPMSIPDEAQGMVIISSA